MAHAGGNQQEASDVAVKAARAAGGGIQAQAKASIVAENLIRRSTEDSREEMITTLTVNS